jgi:hypothetical protein
MSEESALAEAELEMEQAKDIDGKRMALARKLTILNGNWSNLWPACPNRRCQREHSCTAPNAECPMQPPSSEEELNAMWPEVLVDVRRATDERLAQIEAEESK